MLNERDRRILDALERRTGADDPALARLLAAGPVQSRRWRSLRRRLITTPALVFAVILGIIACSLHVSALGVLFFLWALGGIMLRRRAVHDGTARARPGSPDPGRRASWS